MPGLYLGPFHLDSEDARRLLRCLPMAQHYVLDSLFGLPFALAVVFLVWVFWKLGKETKR